MRCCDNSTAWRCLLSGRVTFLQKAKSPNFQLLQTSQDGQVPYSDYSTRICELYFGRLGRRVSDKRLTVDSCLLANLFPGDTILADLGFDIQDSVLRKNKIHAFYLKQKTAR